MKKTTQFFVSILSLGCLTMHADIKKPQTKCPIPTTDQLITQGSSNISSGFYKMFPQVTREEMLTTSVFTYATTQAALGAGQMLMGAMQLATAKAAQTAYNHPQETMAAIVIPTMTLCLQHRHKNWEF